MYKIEQAGVESLELKLCLESTPREKTFVQNGNHESPVTYDHNPSKKKCAVFFKLPLDLQLKDDWQSTESMCDLQAVVREGDRIAGSTHTQTSDRVAPGTAASATKRCYQ